MSLHLKLLFSTDRDWGPQNSERSSGKITTPLTQLEKMHDGREGSLKGDTHRVWGEKLSRLVKVITWLWLWSRADSDIKTLPVGFRAPLNYMIIIFWQAAKKSPYFRLITIQRAERSQIVTHQQLRHKQRHLTGPNAEWAPCWKAIEREN